MDLMEDMYKEELLEHYKHPQNQGKIEDADVEYKDFNPVCGDEIKVFMKINETVEDIKFEGTGCAISQAAASILTEHLKKKQLDAVKKMSSEDMLELLPIKLNHLRMKCGLLALKAIQKGLLIYDGKNV